MAKSKSKSNDETAPASNDISVQGVIFTVPTRYTEGHSCTAEEAAALQQVLSENLRNNFANRVKTAKTEHGETLPDSVVSELRSAFDEYTAGYQFQGKRVRTPVDPVEREAQKMAKSIVLNALKANNISAKDLPEGQMDKYVSDLLAKKPDIREEASRRVAATQTVASEAMAMFSAE